MTQENIVSVLVLSQEDSTRAHEQRAAMMAWLQQKPAPKSTKNPHATRGRRRDLRSLGSQEA